MHNRFLSKLGLGKKMLSEKERIEGVKYREKIIFDAEAMKRLSQNKDFIKFCEILGEDKQSLVKNLLNEDISGIRDRDQRTRLIARINQIDRVLKKPQNLIWQVKNLTEVREVIKEKNLRAADAR